MQFIAFHFRVCIQKCVFVIFYCSFAYFFFCFFFLVAKCILFQQLACIFFAHTLTHIFIIEKQTILCAVCVLRVCVSVSVYMCVCFCMCKFNPQFNNLCGLYLLPKIKRQQTKKKQQFSWQFNFNIHFYLVRMHLYLFFWSHCLFAYN